MTVQNLTRRGILGGIAAVPALVPPFAAAGAAFSAPSAVAGPSTAAWDAAYKRVQDANAEIDACAVAEDRANTATFDASAAIEPTGLREYAWAPIAYQLNGIPLDQLECLYDFPFHAGPESNAAGIVAKVVAYRARRAELEKVHRVEELVEASTQACKRWTHSNRAMFRTPAPTLAALADKVAMLNECDPEDFIGDILADVRRLAEGR